MDFGDRSNAVIRILFQDKYTNVHPSGHPRDNFQRILNSMSACNLMWKIKNGLCEEGKQEIARLTNTSGHVGDQTLFDSHSFRQILEKTDYIGANQLAEIGDNLAPLPKMVYNYVFSQEMRTRYIDVDTTRAFTDSVQAICQDILPMGLFCLNDDSILDYANISGVFSGEVAVAGHSTEIRLPLNRIAGYSYITSNPRTPHGRHLRLYAVIGPFDEILRGPDFWSNSERPLAASNLLRRRSIIQPPNKTIEVVDQKLSLIFAIAPVEESLRSILVNIAESCKAFTNIKRCIPNNRIHRAVAGIEIGQFPYAKNDRPRYPTNGYAETVAIDDLCLTPGKKWTKIDFYYESGGGCLANCGTAIIVNKPTDYIDKWFNVVQRPPSPPPPPPPPPLSSVDSKSSDSNVKYSLPKEEKKKKTTKKKLHRKIDTLPPLECIFNDE